MFNATGAVCKHTCAFPGPHIYDLGGKQLLKQSVTFKPNGCYCCFLTFNVLVAALKKLLYTLANPACGLLNRDKRTKISLAAHLSLDRKLNVTATALARVKG